MWEQKGVAWPRATRCVEPALTKRVCQEPGPERFGGLILRSWLLILMKGLQIRVCVILEEIIVIVVGQLGESLLGLITQP